MRNISNSGNTRHTNTKERSVSKKPSKIAKTIKIAREDWQNVIRFRGWLESIAGRTIDLGEAVAISVKLMLLYLRLGERTRYNVSGKGREVEKLGFELGKKELQEFISEFESIIRPASEKDVVQRKKSKE